MALRVSPAMAARITDYVWSLDEVVAPLPDEQAPRSTISSRPSKSVVSLKEGKLAYVVVPADFRRCSIRA